jgi:hypothetical protein
MPPNCRYVILVQVKEIFELMSDLRSEVDDVNLGLQHFFGDFNVVHTRLISSGVRRLSTILAISDFPR